MPITLRRIVPALTVAVALLAVGASPSGAGSTFARSNWQVLTIRASDNAWVGPVKAARTGTGGVRFGFESFSSTSSGRFSVYLQTGAANLDLTGRTVSAEMSEAVTAGSQFFTRSTSCANSGTDAYVRLLFRSTTSGTYGPSDYWWSVANVNLSSLATQSSATLSVSTADPSAWTNINGQSGADDPTGFANAAKRVKVVGLAFGSSCRYASGVGIASGSGSFELRSFGVS